MKNDFPARCRLRKEKDIQAVLARRDIFRGQRLIFYRAENKAELGEGNEKIHRFCIAVSRQCGPAATRNRIKRVIREIIRLNRHRIRTGFDYIVRVNPVSLSKPEINQDLFFGDFEAYFGWD